MERVITEEKLKQFLKDMDGATSENTSSEKFSLWCNLEDHIHKNDSDATPKSEIGAMSDKILDFYGTACSINPVYTYTDLVKILGTNFEFVDDRDLVTAH